MKVTPAAALALLCVALFGAVVILVTWWQAQDRAVVEEARRVLPAREEPGR